MDWRSLREDRVAGLVHPEDYTPPPAKKEKEPKPALFQVESDSSEEEKSEDDHDCDEEVEEDYDDSFDSVNNGKADYAVGGGGGGIIAQKFRKIRKVVEVQKKKTQPNRMVIATKKVSMTNDSLQPEPEPIQMVATLVEAPTATNPLPAKPKKLHIPTHMDVPHVSEINEDLSREASSKILQELQLRKQKRNQAPAAAQL